MRQPEIEAMDREELELLQLERLQSTLTRAYRQVKFYRRQFDRLGLRLEAIRSLSDLARLPLHHPGRPLGKLPLRPVRRAAPGHRPHPVLPRHHGTAPGGGLHLPGRQTLAGAAGPPLRRCRSDPGRHRANHPAAGVGQLAPGPPGRGRIPGGLGDPRRPA